MEFSNITFLFLFLPAFLVLYFIVGKRLRNLVALGASLLFLAQGEPRYLLLMAGLIVANYFLARQIEKAHEKEDSSFGWTVIGVLFNVGVLLVFKVLTTYGANAIAVVGISLPEWWVVRLNKLPYPLGLSYISFQVISYLIDVHRKACTAEKNFLNFSLYVLLFPKIVVGPITRYRSVAGSMHDREVTSAEVARGLRRFMTGLAKKVLIADQLARIVTPVFSLTTPEVSTGVAWVVLVSYALQVYFDFSGYTDMAIGLGQTLGFRLPENFDYPYITKSIIEFWRRWHISLSSWFRDYVFFPLERRRLKFAGQQINALIVFGLVGLWHGPTGPLLTWGLIHGAAVAFETTGIGRKLRSAWAPLQHLYALSVILLGWVFFRSPTITFALLYLKRLVGLGGPVQPLPFSLTKPLPFIENSVWLALAIGLLFSLPVIPAMQKLFARIYHHRSSLQLPLQVLYDVLLIALLFASVVGMVGGASRPNIYGNF